MKTKKESYAFSEQEVTIAREIASGNHSLFEIRERLAIKPSLLSHYLKKLENKRVITIKRAQQFNEKELGTRERPSSFKTQNTPPCLKTS